jgi:hypothetical protein
VRQRADWPQDFEKTANVVRVNFAIAVDVSIFAGRIRRQGNCGIRTSPVVPDIAEIRRKVDLIRRIGSERKRHRSIVPADDSDRAWFLLSDDARQSGKNRREC